MCVNVCAPVAKPENAKIGVLVQTSEFPSHTHVGTTIFNNFTKEYKYQWDMQASIFDVYKREIETTTGYVVVNLQDIGISTSTALNFVEIKDKNWASVKQNSALMSKLKEQGIFAVVSISEVPTLASLECSQYGCSEHYSQGYGLFTRCFFGMDRYMASASFAVSTEIIQPLLDVAMQEDMREILHFSSKNKEVSDFSDPKDFENITEQELNPIKTEILGYMKSVASLTSQYLIGSSSAHQTATLSNGGDKLKK